MSSDDQPVRPPDDDWVIARSNCTTRDLFVALIADIKRDIQTFNERPEDRRKGRFFYHDAPSSMEPANRVAVFRAVVPQQPGRAPFVPDQAFNHDQVELSLCDDRVAVQRSGDLGWEFVILAKWNEQSLSCDFYIGNEGPVSTYLIRQRILGDFLFE